MIYEIESYESQLRTYDNLIDYTTVTIYISEVERTIAAENQSIWQEIGTNISNNAQDIGAFFTALFIWLASALPYLIILAVAAVIVIVIVKAARSGGKRGPPHGLPILMTFLPRRIFLLRLPHRPSHLRRLHQPQPQHLGNRQHL